MRPQFNFIFEGGEWLDSQAPTTLVSDTEASRTVTVETAYILMLHAVAIYNADDVARVCRVEILDSTDTLRFQLVNESINAGGRKDLVLPHPLPVLGTYKIKFTWEAGGVSSGGTAKSNFIFRRVYRI